MHGVETAEALAELRSQLNAAVAEDDPSRLADALASIAESARILADRLNQKDYSA